MSREPNSEQKPAIEHTGGKLLSAGAGSGKTFVLIEHVKYLTRRWAKEWREKKSLDPLKDFLAEKYSSVVLMTFTRLAAGEIHVRLSDQIEALVTRHSTDEDQIWESAKESLGFLTVTTIDGFFYKLVRLGYFPDLSPDTPIIMYESKRKMILELFDKWWENNLHKIPFDYQRDASMHRKDLSESFVKIMSDPSLRSAWLEFDPTQVSPDNLKPLIKPIEGICGWNNFISRSVEIPEEARKNKWAAMAEALNARRNPIETWDDLLDWYEFCQTEVANTTHNFGKSKALVEDYFAEYKAFKKSILEWGDNFTHYRTHFHNRIEPWLRILKEVILWLEHSLDPGTGLTYGDLEFEVLKNLKQESLCKRIAQDFTYFIVDEFQDTSLVQYEALQLLTLKKLDRLFCVGDIKQAIYGFRGGELAVFESLAEDLKPENNLLMTANYRSEKAVIEFNNHLFAFLFPLGNGWRGTDPFSVKMSTQSFPESDSESKGKITKLHLHLPPAVQVRPELQKKKNPSWRLKDLDLYEAQAFADLIALRLSESPGASIAVLYRKLEPSKLLVKELIKRGIGFTSQAKVPYNQDPLSGILLALLQDSLAEKDGRWATYMVAAYLSILGFSPNPSIENYCLQFQRDLHLYGISSSFNLFLERIHLSNALPEGNLQALLELMKISQNNIETIYQRLKAKADLSWSANFRFGEQAQRVVIQSAHASKGLEYDVVFVGGSFTNGKSKADRSWAGSFPGAALWIENPQLRERRKTISFQFEQLIGQHKLFSESKRLLYVACTRAKKELVLLQASGHEEELKLDDKSWSKAIELYLTRTTLEITEENISLADASEILETSSQPFFHSNNLGMFEKHHDANRQYGIVPELSATKLNALMDCPRQFYFKHVLKINEEELSGWGDEDTSQTPVSSSQRGSEIHLALMEAVEHNMVTPLKYVNHPYKTQIEWALSHLRLVKEKSLSTQFLCEKPMKFPFFGFMLSGIPDLVIREAKTQIWDYKTGRRKPETEKKYWQQLMIYAYAFWSTKLEDLQSDISLTLCYVDEKTLVEKVVSWDQVNTELFSVWSKLSDLSVANTEACGYCPYQEICPR
jgi:ATP-dependent helicase/nuclease subunit A